MATNFAFANSNTSASLNVGGVTAVSSPSANKIVIGEPGCEIEMAGNVTMGMSKCAMCKADAFLGVLLSGAAVRVLFCFSCAKQHLHGSVKELVDALDVKTELEKSS